MLCRFVRAWIGPCGKDAKEGEFCGDHKRERCWCGNQAYRECEVASSFVCGAPLCEEHECRDIAAGLTGSPEHKHSEVGFQQYEQWKGRQEA